MIIFEKIKWKNFLSTGNLYTEIDFKKSNTTIIVGKNGSGKCVNINTKVRLRNKNNGEISITSEENGKNAGWFDVYSKEYYEILFPVHDDWSGYGPWDWYCLIIKNYIKPKGINIQHYTLRGQTIGEYWVGPLLENDGYSGYYKNQLVLNDIPNQRQIFESNMENYVTKGIQILKEKNII